MVLRNHFMPVVSSQKLFFGQASLYTTIGMASAGRDIQRARETVKY
jgi:hypothetical protein